MEQEPMVGFRHHDHKPLDSVSGRFMESCLHISCCRKALGIVYEYVVFEVLACLLGCDTV
jgi:hypothetical protein